MKIKLTYENFKKEYFKIEKEVNLSQEIKKFEIDEKLQT